MNEIEKQIEKLQRESSQLSALIWGGQHFSPMHELNSISNEQIEIESKIRELQKQLTNARIEKRIESLQRQLDSLEIQKISQSPMLRQPAFDDMVFRSMEINKEINQLKSKLS